MHLKEAAAKQVLKDAGNLSETTEKHIEKLYPVRIPVCFSVVSEILLRRKKGDYLCTRVFRWNWQAEP